MRQLDIHDFPLDGVRLIEASAGTGKTWTIAGLYLRLLLEKGLGVTDLLVVTFTEAATQELRGRIRQRLRQALVVLEGGSGDDFLQVLLAPYKDQPAIVQQLRDAITRMDEAAVYTIHGFCQRMLSDNAFESGALFEAEFITEVATLRLRVMEDFWRREVAPASPAKVSWVLDNWSSPEKLLKAIAPLLERPVGATRPDADADNAQAAAHYRQLFQALVTGWREHGQDMMALLRGENALKRNESAWREDRLAQLETDMAALLALESAPLALPGTLPLLAAHMISDPANHDKNKLKKGLPVPEHPLFALADELVEAGTRQQSLERASFLLRAAGYVSTQTAALKRDNRLLFFDDLLSSLAAGLRGDGGEALAERIRRRYPVAMIDEFQDTDPQQYTIFSRIYGEPATGANTALFMIGDPKQAIYSFRGADIFTYMQARHDTDPGTSHFTLATNFRSSTALVDSINGLFGNTALAPFLYEGEIDFLPTTAGGKADETPFLLGAAPAAPLKCWLLENSDDKPEDKGRGRARIALGCAIDIASLLAEAGKGRATIGERPVQASDIAILVSNRYQADAVRRELSSLGIGSVFISRDSVFATEEASHFARVLLAVSEPGHATAVRTALATRLFGLTADDIQTLAGDEASWDSHVEQFRGWQALWLKEGFMVMFRDLIRHTELARRLLAAPEGERRLTNFLQLAELAQLASEKSPGLEGVLRWLETARSEPDGDAGEQQLRLESEENLVQVVTIHKSKGLQYNIVYLPFLWDCREENDRQDILLAHDEDTRQLVADLGSAERQHYLALARKERLAEDVRLLYVALTRARYRNVVAWGQLRDADKSALAWLLHPPADYEAGSMVSTMSGMGSQEIREALLAFGRAHGDCLELVPLPGRGDDRLTQATDTPATVATAFRGNAGQAWAMTSFSGLSHAAHDRPWQIDLPDHDQLQDHAEPELPAATDSPFAFPRGAQAGLFLHHVFEQIDFTLAGNGLPEGLVRESLELYGIDWRWQDVVQHWLVDVLNTPLDEEGLMPLAQVGCDQRLVELEFHFPLGGLTAGALNDLLQEYRGRGSQSPALGFAAIRGMMKGFIDLVFTHGGQYFILDYKSNHLGNRLDDYAPRALVRAIADSHYDLQYLVYLVALHRYLSQRLPGYDYDSYIGGVYYLFLRGMASANGNRTGVFHDRPDKSIIERLDKLFIGGGA